MTRAEPAPKRIDTGAAIEPKAVPAIRIPKREHGLDQNEEWCEIHADGAWRRVRFHDYDEIFSIPGLYETLFHETLRCTSPERVVRLLHDALKDTFQNPAEARVLDVGAGNGLVGERLRAMGAASVVGVDIIPEARDAALRDRPGVYDDYLVCDLTDLTPAQRRRIESHRCDCMTVVAALGFDDIPPRAFAAAFNLLETPAWAAFNLNVKFLRGDDDSGFARLVRAMQREGVIDAHAHQRYPHRLGIDGEWLQYAAFVARKRRDIPESLLDEIDP